MRGPVAAIYAFARRADDLADEGILPAAARREALARLEQSLDEALAGQSPDGPLRALADSVARFRLPDRLLRDLLSAFRQDTAVNRYATFEDLRRYCRRSADPVGRLVLRLAGRDEPELDELSDAVCSGLQLANFCQDLSVDLPRGRLYLPLEDLERFGCSAPSLLGGRPDGDLAALAARQIERSSGLLRAGAPLGRRLGGRLGFWVRWVVRGGLAILERSAALGPRLLHERPVLGRPRQVALALAALGDGVRGR
jgi:squalene synthase HpnC